MEVDDYRKAPALKQVLAGVVHVDVDEIEVASKNRHAVAAQSAEDESLALYKVKYVNMVQFTLSHVHLKYIVLDGDLGGRSIGEG
eukprot:668569-Amorphochlora_amoeboformis.AAC.2